jgi:hypothetical protein
MTAELRQAVVAEATTWLGTPYHHMGRVKGAGVDCLTLLAEVYERAGVIEHCETPFYPPDWNLHRSEELYLGGVLDRAIEIAGPPQPGDIGLFKFGRCFAHGVIVTAWPQVIHAHYRAGVIGGDATQGDLVRRAVRFFDPIRSSRGAPHRSNFDRSEPASRLSSGGPRVRHAGAADGSPAGSPSQSPPRLVSVAAAERPRDIGRALQACPREGGGPGTEGPGVPSIGDLRSMAGPEPRAEIASLALATTRGRR